MVIIKLFEQLKMDKMNGKMKGKYMKAQTQSMLIERHEILSEDKFEKDKHSKLKSNGPKS